MSTQRLQSWQSKFLKTFQPIRKVYKIDTKGKVSYFYEVKPSSIQLRPEFDNLAPHFVLEFQYPKLEVTYEKEFMTLDWDNWLGEVGGLGFLLFMLYSGFGLIVALIFKHLDQFSYTDLSHKEEGFAQF